MFEILPIGCFQDLNLCNHVVALFHPFIDEIDLVVDENGIVLDLLFKESEGFLLRLKLVLNSLKDSLFEDLRIVGGHSHDILDTIMKGGIVFLEFLDLVGVLYDLVLDWVDYLLDDFPDASLHFEPLKLLDRRASSGLIGLFGVVLNAGHAIKLIIKFCKFIYFWI
jgi:hypothetical protein